MLPLWIFLLFLAIKDHVVVRGSIQADITQKQVVNIGLAYQVRSLVMVNPTKENGDDEIVAFER